MLIEASLCMLALGFDLPDLSFESFQGLGDGRIRAPEPECGQEDPQGEGQNNSGYKCCGLHAPLQFGIPDCVLRFDFFLRTRGAVVRIGVMDFRYALRALARNPGYAAVVILILAVGIGANTAMFGIVDGVLLRALPFHDPEQLYAVQESVPKFANLAPDFPVNAMHFEEWRRRWTSAEQISLIDARTFNLTSGGEPERVNAARVSANLFPMLGVQPQVGRGFLEEEDHPGRDHVILLSDSMWRRRFHADPNVLGQKVILNDEPFEVIGVMPAGLKMPRLSQLQSMHIEDADPEIWKPLAIKPEELELMGDFNFGVLSV